MKPDQINDLHSAIITLLGFEPSKGNNWGRRDSSINLQNLSTSTLLVVMRTSNTPSVQIAAMAECLLPLTSIFAAMAGVSLGERWVMHLFTTLDKLCH